MNHTAYLPKPPNSTLDLLESNVSDGALPIHSDLSPLSSILGSARLVVAWTRLKQTGLDLGRAPRVVAAILTKLDTIAKNPNYQGDLLLSEIEKEFAPLIRAAYLNEDLGQRAAQTVRGLFAATATSNPVNMDYFTLIRTGFESPFSCEECIRAFVDAALCNDQRIRQECYRWVHRLVGIPNGDDVSDKQILAQDILCEIFSRTDQTLKELQKPFASLVYKWRVPFLVNTECWYFSPTRNKADELLHRYMKRAGFDASKLDSCFDDAFDDPSVNKFIEACFSALPFLDETPRLEMKRELESHIQKHMDPNIYYAWSGCNNVTEILLDALKFGKSGFTGFPDGEYADALLGSECSSIFCSRFRKAPLDHAVKAFVYLGQHIDPNWPISDYRSFLRLGENLLKRICKTKTDVSSLAEEIGVIAGAVTESIEGFEINKLKPSIKRMLDGFRTLVNESSQFAPSHAIIQLNARLDQVIEELKPEGNGALNPTPHFQPTKSLDYELQALDEKIERHFLDHNNQTPHDIMNDSLIGLACENTRLDAGLKYTFQTRFPRVMRRLTDLGLPEQITLNLAHENQRVPLFLAWQVGNEARRLGFLLIDHLQKIRLIETACPGGVKRLYEDFGIINFARYASETMLGQLLKPPSKFSSNRPIHLFYPRADHNGAYSERGSISSLKELSNRDLVIHEYSSPTSLARRTLWARRNFGSLNNIGILGHGGADGFGGPQAIELQRLWSLEVSRLLAKILGDPTHIFLDSCHSGDRNGLIDILAQKLRGRNFTIIGGVGTHCTRAIDFASETGFSLSTSTSALKYYGYSDGRVRRYNISTQAIRDITHRKASSNT